MWTKQKRFLQGKKAQRQGKSFEEMIKEQSKFQGIKCFQHHVPKTVSKGKLIYLEKGAPDFNLIAHGGSVYFDAKSIDGQSISHSRLNQHQVADLADIKLHGHNAGYLCWFKTVGVVGFIPVGDLVNLKPMSSIKYDQTIILGSSIPGIEPDINFARLFSLDWEEQRCPNCRGK